MLNLEVLEDSRHQSGNTTFLSINPNSIVTMKPVKNGVWEYRQLRGPDAQLQEFTEITYSIGNETRTVVALGNFKKLSSKIKSSKGMLYG